MSRILLAVLLLTVTSLLSVSDKTQEGQELLDQARLKSDLHALPSFTMKAAVKIDNQGESLAGKYLLLWNGPDQWREEIAFPGFHEVRVGGSGTVATKRDVDFLPLRIHQLQRVLGYGEDGLTLREDEKIKQVHARKVNKVEARCLEITSKENSREVCVNPLTGGPVRDHPFFDEGRAPIETIVFPHTLSYREEKKPVVEVEVTDIRVGEHLPSSSFGVPAGAVSAASCMNPSEGRLIKKVPPLYPNSEKLAHREGTIAIYALIGADGSPRNLRIIESVSSGLDAASLDAVRQWRYEPYRCQGTPVSQETVIQVNYKLNFR